MSTPTTMPVIESVSPWDKVVAEEARREVLAALSEGRCWVCGGPLVPCSNVCPDDLNWLICEAIVEVPLPPDEHGRCYRMRRM